MKNTIILLLILCLYQSGLFAQNDTIYIEEILVEAKQTDRVLLSNISASSIELTNPRDAGEIFKTQTGFGVVKRGNYAMEPVLRGFKYEQLNLQIDGGVKSTTACPSRMDPTISQISPDEIEKVEVIRGPYSVRYGSSLGGVLNVISKIPETSDEFSVKGNLEGGYESNGDNLFSNLHLTLANKKFDAIINASWKDFGNYKSSDGQEMPSSFQRSGYSLKVGFNATKKHRLQFNWRQGFARDVLHAGLPIDADIDNSSILSIDYLGTQISKSIMSMKAKVYGSFVDHEMSNKRRPNTKMVDAVSNTEASVLGGRFELAIRGGEKDLIYTGLDFSNKNKDGDRNRIVYKNHCSVPPVTYDPPKEFTDLVFQDSYLTNYGVFAENRFQINSSLLWVVGTRIDYVLATLNKPAPDFLELYDGNIGPQSDINLGINSSITYIRGKGPEIQWAIGRGVRSADINERFINHFTVGMDAYEYVGDPYLKPEVNYQTDLGITQDFGKISVFGNVFYSYLEDYISAMVDTSLSRKYMPCMNPEFAKRFANVDKAFMTGFEAGFDLTFIEKVYFDLGIGYTYAQNKSWDEPLPEIPPLTLNSSVFYKDKKLQAGIRARIANKQVRVSENFNESATPGFSVMDFLLAYKPVKCLEFKFSITNLLDENYAEHLSRPYKNMATRSLYYEPGRSINVSLKIIL